MHMNPCIELEKSACNLRRCDQQRAGFFKIEAGMVETEHVPLTRLLDIPGDGGSGLHPAGRQQGCFIVLDHHTLTRSCYFRPASPVTGTSQIGEQR
jgi:hypothetical protein